MNPLTECSLCPRRCGVDRTIKRGRCGAGADIEVSKTMLHVWEEPPISGQDKSRGSGAIFFTHCPLGCVYCQNGKISRAPCVGEIHSPDSLAGEMLALEEKGAYNINCVSPTHYSVQIAEAVRIARKKGLSLPIVWNTGGYELPEVISSLGGVVDVFLTDFKYASDELASLYSNAPDYPGYAAASLKAMHSLVGAPKYGDDGMMKRGVIVRHLVLPSHRDDSIAVLNRIADIVPPDGILLSLMAQYTPDFLPEAQENDRYVKIRRKITTYEYDRVADEAVRLGFEGFMQERSSATARFTPDF